MAGAVNRRQQQWEAQLEDSVFLKGGRVVCVFSLREDTQEGLVGLCEAGCRVLSVSAAPALEREFYA